MAGPSIPDIGTSPPAYVHIRDLENMAKIAADKAVEGALARVPSREELVQIAKAAASEAAKEAAKETARETIEQFLETIGVDPKDKVGLRKDFASVRSSRELQEAMKRHGLLAATGLLVAAAVTAMWLGAKGMMIR